MKPPDGFILTEPGHLLSGINTRIAFYLVQRHGKRPLAIEISEQLFIAHSIKGVACSVRENPLSFSQKPLPDHAVDTGRNTCVQLVTLTPQSDFQYLERSFFYFPLTKRGECATGHVTYLQSMNNSLGIAHVAGSIILWIAQPQLFSQRCKPFMLVTVTEKCPRFIIDRRYIINSPADCVDIHHGTARQQYDITLLKERRQQPEHICLILSCTIIFLQSQRPDEIMGYTFSFGQSRRRRSDRNIAINLP